jgi:chromosome segregation ATPase
MFNLFPKVTIQKNIKELKEEINDLFPTWTWTTTTITDENGKEITVQQLIEKYNALKESNNHLRGEAERFYKELQTLKKAIKLSKEDNAWDNVAGDLALRVVKLERQVEELKLAKIDPNDSNPLYKHC